MKKILDQYKRGMVEEISHHWYPKSDIFKTKGPQKKNSDISIISQLINISVKITTSIIKPLLYLFSIIYLVGLFLTNKKSPPPNSKNSNYTNFPKIFVIGNVLVGGVGKTPTTICLIHQLLKEGVNPAVISRGYKSLIDGKKKNPQIVNLKRTNLNYREFGDEPCLIAESGVPVFVGNRFEAMNMIKLNFPKTDVVLLDDGLQQSQIPTNKKILVVDERLFGNEKVLPFGPLREPIPLRHEIDGLILNNSVENLVLDDVLNKIYFKKKEILSSKLRIKGHQWKNFSNEILDHTCVKNKINQNYEQTKAKPLAVAGIGVPSRFFSLLEKQNIEFEPLWLPNHDINFVSNVFSHLKQSQRIVLMTEKDSVKMTYSDITNTINHNQFFILKINFYLEQKFISNILNWI